jgi:hypothetical protein
MEERFIGGLRMGNPAWFSGGGNATWPFAGLTVGDEGITLAVRGRLGSLFRGKWFNDFEPVRIGYDELVRVELIRLRRGIRFHTQSLEERGRSWDRRNGAIFWRWRIGPVLEALTKHGVAFR